MDFKAPRIRIWRQAFIVCVILTLSWFGMMATHELSHALGAWATGGTVQRIVVPVLGFSRTDVQPNLSPGVVVWAGPVVGILLALALWLIAFQMGRPLFEKPLRFFAGFCLIANGTYLSLGTFDRIGDVDVMLNTGTPVWVLWIFGAAAVSYGFFLWHGLGPKLGLNTPN